MTTLIVAEGLMKTHPNSRLFSNLKSCSQGASWVVILFGCLGLAGWTFEIDPLKNVFHGLPSTVPNTAMAFVLAGFSQGGAVALHAGLRQNEALAGIMALSTYLPLSAMAEREFTVAGRATSILMCHGRHDQVLAFEMGTRSRDFLRALGVSVQWHEYPMAHEVCAAEINDISAWLRLRLQAYVAS